jgi:hypothetical protein
MKNPKELMASYPYMFEGQNIGISFMKGWFILFAKLCQDIDAVLGEDKHGFHWTQCKEKFGSARFYWGMKGHQSSTYVDIMTPDGFFGAVNKPAKKGSPVDLIAQQIDALVEAATKATNIACIVCGELGNRTNHDGYMLVLCKKHEADNVADKTLDIWFPEEEQ